MQLSFVLQKQFTLKKMEAESCLNLNLTKIIEYLNECMNLIVCKESRVCSVLEQEESYAI